mgnify:FL=1
MVRFLTWFEMRDAACDKMRYLALDVGNKRVGIAVGSSEGRIATPLAVFVRTSMEQDCAQILKFAREYDVEQIIVGLPRHAPSEANNTPGEQETLTRAYIEQLRPSLNLPIAFYDERYSTAAAMQQQRMRGVNEKRGRATLDASAAAVILQDFLDKLETGD